MRKNEIHVLYGNDPKRMVRQLLDCMDAQNGIPRNGRIGIKPNLVVAKPSHSGATTSPELVAGIVEYLRDNGVGDIFLFEGSWIGEDTQRAFKVCGYADIAKEYGIRLIDTKKDATTTREANGMSIRVCETLVHTDFIINVPVLKGHCQTRLTCALKNMKGCIPDSEKRRFHSLGLHRPIACLNTIRTADLIVVDGLCGDLDFEEGGNPVQSDRIFAGTDPVLIDAYAAGLLGFELREIPYIEMAADLGVGSCDLQRARIVEHNQCDTKLRPVSSRKVLALARHVIEKDACSACYAHLIRALLRLREKGKLPERPWNIHIGRGFRGRAIDGVGVGNCCAHASEGHVAGCPPDTLEICRLLESSAGR